MLSYFLRQMEKESEGDQPQAKREISPAAIVVNVLFVLLLIILAGKS